MALLILSWSMLLKSLPAAGMELVLLFSNAPTLLVSLLLRPNNPNRPPQAATARAAPSGLNARLVTRWLKAHA